MATRGRPFPPRSTRRAYSSPPCDNCTSTKFNPEDFVTRQDRLAERLGFSLVLLSGFGLYVYLKPPGGWTTSGDGLEREVKKLDAGNINVDPTANIRERTVNEPGVTTNEPEPTSNESGPTSSTVEPTTDMVSIEIAKWATENDKREMKRENARQKELRKDTYNRIREIQKELQKIDPAYQPDDGACQWRAAGDNFGQYTSNQLHELQKEMRKINPSYGSDQGASRDDHGKSRSNDDLLHELQRALRKMKPEYKPGWPASILSLELTDELCDVSHALIALKCQPVKSGTEVLTNPDVNSEDAVESLAAKLKNPELRPHFRSGWDSCFIESYQKDDIREMVDEHMGIFGIKWSREGNPFGTDDDDDI
ncbi:MAG: hypothetical protein Q9207_007378 [Kuettlingeria erythrocarpa]